MLPLLGLTIAIGFAANFFQIGALLVFEPLKPSLDKLNPMSKAKQIFSMKNFMEFVKSVVKVTFLSVLIYLVIRDALPSLMLIPSYPNPFREGTTIAFGLSHLLYGWDMRTIALGVFPGGLHGFDVFVPDSGIAQRANRSVEDIS